MRQGRRKTRDEVDNRRADLALFDLQERPNERCSLLGRRNFVTGGRLLIADDRTQLVNDLGDSDEPAGILLLASPPLPLDKGASRQSACLADQSFELKPLNSAISAPCRLAGLSFVSRHPQRRMNSLRSGLRSRSGVPSTSRALEPGAPARVARRATRSRSRSGSVGRAIGW